MCTEVSGVTDLSCALCRRLLMFPVACLIGAYTRCSNVGDSTLYVDGASNVVDPDAAAEGCTSDGLVSSSSAASSFSALAWSRVSTISSASIMKMVSPFSPFSSQLLTQHTHNGRFFVIMVPTMHRRWHLCILCG